MNTYIVINRRPVSVARTIELCGYLVLAVLLIGQILFVGGTVSFADVMFVYVGAVAGLLFSCQASPLSTGLQLIGRSVRVPDVIGALRARRDKSSGRISGGNTGSNCTA